mmetsp:Transcript_25002/g.83802  ORF Transcript_25002/g.83802 Transcript_25002/m.83802 type:complete len:202 (+) Transcript_25002:508-1113(+)
MKVSSLRHARSAGAADASPPGGSATIFLRATWSGSAGSRPSATRSTKAVVNQLTQMCAALKARAPVAGSVRAAISSETSEYSTTLGLPSRSASTPTFSWAWALGTVLEAHSAPSDTQRPTKVGSATWHMALSTQSWKRDSTPAAVTAASAPDVRSARYTPPLPSGAMATSPGARSRMSPSVLRHGSIPCWKKSTWAAPRPK